MANYDTGKDILEDVLFRAGELGVGKGSDFEAAAKRYVHRAYWDIVGEFPWLWAVKQPPLQFSTVKKLDVTVTVTEGSVAATLGADPGVSVAGRKLVLERDGIPIRISASAGTSLTLAAGYPGKSATSVDADIFQDEYDTDPDILMPISLKDVESGENVDIVSAEYLDGLYPKHGIDGSPVLAAFVTTSILRLYPSPDSLRVLELRYTFRPAALDFTGLAATDTPIVPIDYRWTIADRALFFAMSDIEDTRAQDVLVLSAARLGELRSRQLAMARPRVWFSAKHRVGVR